MRFDNKPKQYDNELLMSYITALNSRERKKLNPVKAIIIANRVCKGWAFTGQTLAEHNVEFQMLVGKILSLLEK